MRTVFRLENLKGAGHSDDTGEDGWRVLEWFLGK